MPIALPPRRELTVAVDNGAVLRPCFHAAEEPPSPRLVTVTSSESLRCEWCGSRFERPHTSGPAPRYCSRAHRQRAYEARRQAKATAQAVSSRELARFREAAAAMSSAFGTSAIQAAVAASLPKVDVRGSGEHFGAAAALRTVAAASPKIDASVVSAALEASGIQETMEAAARTLDVSGFQAAAAAVAPRLDTSAFVGAAARPHLAVSALQRTTDAMARTVDVSGLQAALAEAVPRLDASHLAAAASPKLDVTALQAAVAAATPKLDTSAIEAAAAAALPTSFLSQFRAAMDDALPRLDTSAIQAALDAAISDIDWESLRQTLEAEEAEGDDRISGRSTTETLYATVAVLLAYLVLAYAVIGLAQPLSDAAEDTAKTTAMAARVLVEMAKRVTELDDAIYLYGLAQALGNSRKAARRRSGHRKDRTEGEDL